MACKLVGLPSPGRQYTQVRSALCPRSYVFISQRSNRPVVWSSSSTIFTAHSSQPLLLGRVFPSSKQFVVVSPEPILRAPSSFEPASVISVSPNDHWLFAFFPAREGDGIGCLWKRGFQVDSWTVWECWPFSRGAGVVTAAWAGVDREVCNYHVVPDVIDDNRNSG